MKRDLVIEGKFIRLEEVQPKHFPYIIEWRNNPENNKYLNQPFKLTMELQTKWYEEKYLKDDTQGLFVAIDKDDGVPFATIGWTDYDVNKHILIAGRLLVGKAEYRGSMKWYEATLLANKYLYEQLGICVMYSHVVIGNVASEKWHKKWGYRRNGGMIAFPCELVVNGMRQHEYYRTYEMFSRANNN